MRNRAGIIQRFPTGTDEVEYSNVTKTESRMDGVVWDAAGTGGGYSSILPGDIRDKEEFYRAEKSNVFI